MSKKREVKVVYRRWTLIIPVLLLILGSILMFVFWSINTIISLFGGMLILIGLLSFGLLLVMVISLELSTRSLQHKRPIPPPLSEDFKKAEREKDAHKQKE
ncbi:MAG: hypothetical protein ACFFCH_00335 [Promethearchaeota archaeon]